MDCVDALGSVPAWLRGLYPAGYLFLVHHTPWLWQACYRLLDTAPVYALIQPLRRRWNLLMSRELRRRLAARPFDAVLVTHFLPADVCNSLKRSGALSARLVVVVTDLHPHRLWLAPAADAFVVGIPQSASVLLTRGVSERRVRVLGIPVGGSFCARHELAVLRQKFGLDAVRRTALVTSGGTTVGRFEETVRDLMGLERAHPGGLQLLVVCGDAEDSRRRVAAAAAGQPMPVRVYGFVENMAEFMAVSDLVVAKAGGLTVSEALALGKPLLFYHIIPGQEELNARYVAGHGAGVIAAGAGEAAAEVARCLEEPERLRRMEQAAESLRRPNAAAEIMEEVVKPLLESVV